MIEILIALFVFLIGVLGILSLFPVAMSTAGKSIGETRANVLAQSALAQLKFDCTYVYERGPVSSATAQTLVRATPAGPRVGYYVTIVSGTGTGQSRRIPLVTVGPPSLPGDDGTTIRLDDSIGDRWNITPDATSTYVITRLGLPDVAVPGFLNGAGQNRNLVVRSFVPDNGLCAGYPLDTVGAANLDPFRSGANTVAPFIGDTNSSTTDVTAPADVTTTMGQTLNDSTRAWTVSQFRNYIVRMVQTQSGVSTLQCRKVLDNTATALTITPPWTVMTGAAAITTTYEVGMVDNLGQWGAPANVNDGQWTRLISFNTATSGSLNTLTRAGAFASPGTPTRAAQGEACYVVLRAGRGEGQARMISASTSDTITVVPDFNVAPDNTTVYDIFASRAYVLITSGRAAGRIYPIAGDYYTGRIHTEDTASAIGASTLSVGSATWTAGAMVGSRVRLRSGATAGQVRYISANTTTQLTVSPAWNPTPASLPAFETAPGWLIYCPNADFQRHNVIPCERPAAAGYSASLQDGTTFSIIGPGAGVLPSRAILPVAVAPVPDLATLPFTNIFNVVTGANRTAPDTFGAGSYTSDHSCIAVFSDTGADVRNAVRVDIFVYRNFNPAKELSDNQKPVGYVTGCIERP